MFDKRRAFNMSQRCLSTDEQTIDMSHRKLTARDLSYLGAYLSTRPSITRLLLNDCQLSDQDLALVKDLPVEHLEIQQNYIGACGLNTLCDNQNLMSVHIARNYAPTRSIANLLVRLMRNREYRSQPPLDNFQSMGADYRQQDVSERGMDIYNKWAALTNVKTKKLKKARKACFPLMAVLPVFFIITALTTGATGLIFIGGGVLSLNFLMLIMLDDSIKRRDAALRQHLNDEFFRVVSSSLMRFDSPTPDSFTIVHRPPQSLHLDFGLSSVQFLPSRAYLTLDESQATASPRETNPVESVEEISIDRRAISPRTI